MLREGVLQKLGMNKEIQLALGNDSKWREETLKRMQTDDLSNLPTAQSYVGSTMENTETVMQGRAIVADLQNNCTIQGLQTFGAGPCSILILTSQRNAEINKIAMAHIDAAANSKDVSALLSKMGSGSEIEATVISGTEDAALAIGKALESSGTKLKFASIDPLQQRIDSAIIDRNGTVFYGFRRELVPQVDAQALYLDLMTAKEAIRIKSI